MTTAAERAAGERDRLRHAMTQLRATIDSIQIAIDMSVRGVPPSPDLGQAIAQAGSDMACGLARLAAYMHMDVKR